jgi:hypothetical protein
MSQEEFDKKELEALKKIASERIAYDTLTNKLKSNWIWIVGGGVLTIWALWDKFHALLFTVK